jgi:hypothetical protein
MTTSAAFPRILTFEEIPAIQRPAAAVRYLRLLDEGVLPKNIRFADYAGTLRVEPADPSGSDGTSRGVPPVAELLADQPPITTATSGDEAVERRRSLLAALVGQRVRLRWPGGHQRVGVLEHDERFGYGVTPQAAVYIDVAGKSPVIEAR